MKVKELIDMLKFIKEETEIRIEVEKDTFLCIERDDVKISRPLDGTEAFLSIDATNW